MSSFKPFDARKDIPRLDGKIAVVTGGKWVVSELIIPIVSFWDVANARQTLNSAGIGYTSVEQLALHGAKVYMASRNESRANAAIKKIRDEYPTIPESAIVWVHLDLVDPHSIVRAVESISSREKWLDIVLCNGGNSGQEFVTTSIGEESIAS